MWWRCCVAIVNHHLGMIIVVFLSHLFSDLYTKYHVFLWSLQVQLVFLVSFTRSTNIYWLVVSTHLKNIRQNWTISPIFGVKIKKIFETITQTNLYLGSRCIFQPEKHKHVFLIATWQSRLETRLSGSHGVSPPENFTPNGRLYL